MNRTPNSKQFRALVAGAVDQHAAAINAVATSNETTAKALADLAARVDALEAAQCAPGLFRRLFGR